MQVKLLPLLLSLAAALASCGGGGGAGYTITGVAASGAAIVGGTVEVQCVVGSGSAQTEADGSYRIVLRGAQGPCLLRAIDPVTGIELHSALEEDPAQPIAHITPLSDLVVARAVQTAPSTAFADPAAYLQRLSPANLSTGAQAAREAALAVGTPLPEGLDPLKGELRTATAEAQGSIMDRAVDTLMATLAAADRALSELALSVARLGAGVRGDTTPVNGGGDGVVDGEVGGGGGVGGGGVVIGGDINVRSALEDLVLSSSQSLPGCPAARGGRVWLIDALSGLPPQGHELSLENNSPQLIRLADDNRSPITVGAPCVFTADGKTFRISDSGMGIWNSAAGWGVIVPMQPSVDLTVPSFTGQYGALALMQATFQGIDFTPAAAFDFSVNAPGRPLIESRQCAINTGNSTALPGCNSLGSAFAMAFEATQCENVLLAGDENSGALRCRSGQVDAHVIGFKAGGSSTVLITLNNYPLSAGAVSLPGRGLVVLNKVSRPMVLPQVSSIAGGAFWEGGYDPTASPRFYSTPVAQSSLSRIAGSSTSYQQTRGSVTYTHHLDTPARGLLWSRSGNAGVMIRLASPAGWSFAAEKVEMPALAGFGDMYRLSAQVRRPTTP